MPWGMVMTLIPISKINRDYFPFSLQKIHGWAESLQFLEDNESTISQICQHSDLKQLSSLSTIAPWILI